MRIAYLTNQYPKVSHSFIRREIAALEELGFEVSRYSIRRVREKLADDADRAEVVKTSYVLDHWPLSLVASTAYRLLTRPVQFLRAATAAWRMGRRSGSSVARHAIYLMEACWLASDLQRQGVEHVHVHFGTNSATVMLLAKQLGGTPFSFTCHGPEEFDRPDQLSLTEKIVAADFVVAVSSFGRSQLFRWCPHEHWRKVQVVHCGLAEDYWSIEPTAPAQAPRLVCIGRLCEQKGQLLLIEAAARLKNAGVEFELVLVGDGELRSEVDRLALELGVSDRITITGWQSGPEVREHLLQARVLLMTSFAEGLPVAIMESLALGRPVLSTYIAGIPELVVPGRTGWLIPAGSVDDLTFAMRQALEADATQIQEMGEEGRRRVFERHNVATEAAKLASLFNGEAEGEPFARSNGPG